MDDCVPKALPRSGDENGPDEAEHAGDDRRARSGWTEPEEEDHEGAPPTEAPELAFLNAIERGSTQPSDEATQGPTGVTEAP